MPAPPLNDAIEPAAEGAEPQLVILTDHNEPGQSVAGLENATIFGVQNPDHDAIPSTAVLSLRLNQLA